MRPALITPVLLLACALALASAQLTNRSCASGPECSVCERCCEGIPLEEDCENCVELNCEADEDEGESWGELLRHLLDFVASHTEVFLTVLAALPIAGRLSDFSIGAARRRLCPQRKVIVMSAPEEGTRRADGEGPYDEDVMKKVAELQRRGRLKMGFDRKGTSTQHPADEPDGRRAAGKALVDWQDAASIRSTQWFYGFVTAGKKVMSIECQGFDGILVVVCIRGGPVTRVEHEAMNQIIADATSDAKKSGVMCRIERREMSYAEFLREYDEGWFWRALCCWCPRCVRVAAWGSVSCRCCCGRADPQQQSELSEGLLAGGGQGGIGDAALDALLSSVGEPEPEPEPEAAAASGEALSRPVSPERGGATALPQAPAGEEEPEERGGYRVGQRLWCRDSERQHWQRGVVTGFGQHNDYMGKVLAENSPLVRVTEGLDEEPRAFSHCTAAKNPGYVFSDIGYSWAVARAMKGQSQCAALLEAAGKLLFWHWLQPALYFAMLWLNWGEIGAAQRGFGSAVAVREALYFIQTTVCLWFNPAFLLVDVGATVRSDEENGFKFLAMYVLAPEKFVFYVLSRGSPLGPYEGMLILKFAMLCDVCSVGALASGVSEGRLPAGLAIGYVATTAAFLVVIGIGARLARREAEEKKDKDDIWVYLGCEGCVILTIVTLVAGTTVAVLHE